MHVFVIHFTVVTLLVPASLSEKAGVSLIKSKLSLIESFWRKKLTAH